MYKITVALGSSLCQMRIALLGLAFQEGTNDVRHSLSIRLFRALRDQGASVIGHDLLAVEEAMELEPGLEASADVGTVLAGAEVVVALNSEPVYAEIDWSIAGAAARPPFVIDTRGVLDTSAPKGNGIKFDILGLTG